MASRKASKRGKSSRGKKYHGSRKTVRGHRRSTSGIIYPPLDVRSPQDLSGILKRITKGPITVVLVYADWCGHCHTLMPHFKKASNMPNRNSQVISIRDDMLEEYNNTVNSKINSKAPELNVEGYPSVLLVGPDGKKLSEIASTKEAVESAMTTVAPVAVEAGLSQQTSNNNEMMNNTAAERENALLKEIGVANTGLANMRRFAQVSSNQSFEHLNRNRNEKANYEMFVKAAEEVAEEAAEEAAEEVAKEAEIKELSNDPGVATSLSIKSNKISPVKLSNTPRSIPSSAITKSEADNIVSIQSILPASESPTPVSPPDTKLALRSIHNITGSNRLKGGAHGYGHGGSLYGMMSQTAYKLAPAAVLLATASAVMNQSHRRKRSTKRSNRTKRNRSRK